MSARSFRRESERRRAREQRRRAGIAAASVAGMAAFAAPAAQAAEFEVTNLTDADPGSLRAAVDAANSTPASDDIVFQSGLSGQINLASHLEVDYPVSIAGPGASVITVSGSDNDRVFDIDLGSGSGPVSISGLTLTDGFSEGSGGAVHNADAELTISYSVITDSVSGLETLDGGAGGGVFSSGPLTVISSTVSGNTSGFAGSSGKYGVGGGIASSGDDQPLILTDSTVNDNDGELGGGVYALDGAVITNSTISGNTADRGGGLFSEGADADDVFIRSSTVAGNDAYVGGGIFRVDGSASEVALSSTIVADNAASVGGDDIHDASSAAGDRFTAEFSLIEATDNPFTDLGQNITGQDPQLAPLGGAGGPTETQLPAATSPAIDKGNSPGLSFDQRGLPRVADFPSIANAAGGDGSDIGAVERDSLELNPGPIVGQERSKRICLGQEVTILGTTGKDKITGTEGRDVIRGLRGNDRISGLGGDDVICGDKGSDRIGGGAGNDEVRGGNGGDRIKGGGGDDLLRGGSGLDRIFGGADSDAMFGGSKQGKKSKGGAKGPPPPGNLCDGGPGADTATGCETVEGVP